MREKPMEAELQPKNSTATVGSASPLRTALGYRGRGWAVIPVGNDKRSLLKWAEFQHRRPTEHEVKSWFSQWPDAGVGIVCGRVSGGLVVMDVDPRHGGDDSLDELVRNGHKLPDTPIARTGGGGSHSYLRCDGEVPTIPAILAGVDLKGEGSYVVAPPSGHPSGGRYEWLISPDMVELAPIPAWLMEMVQSRKAPGKTPLVLPPVVPAGERNATLFRLAAAMPPEKTVVIRDVEVTFQPCPEAGPPDFTIPWWGAKMRQEHIRGERLRIALNRDPCGCETCRSLNGLTAEQALADPEVQRVLRWIKAGLRGGPERSAAQTAPAAPSVAETPDTKIGPTKSSRGRPKTKFVSPMDMELCRRLPLRAAADALGVSRETVRRWLKGAAGA
jgi:hypothetical protein